jgi:iron complex outermembrane receptor protein
VTSDASKTKVNENPPMMPRSPNQLYALYYNGAQADKKRDDNIGGLLRLEHDLARINGTLFAGVSRSVRTPDASERYLASNGSMTMPAWVGNPDIDSEKHHQVELGIVLHGSRWDAEGSVYYNDVDDFILRDRRDDVPMAPEASIYRNIDATLYGGELRLGYRWSDNWRSHFGLAYVRAKNDTDDRDIAQTPPLEGTISLDYSAGDWDAGARVRAAAQQTKVDTTSSTGIEGDGLDVRKTPGWGVLDLYARYELNDNLTVDVGVDNLFDKNYAQHLNRANAFDPTQVQVNEPGRSAWLAISAAF